jgi:cellulose biosynthesis protein BcsQ
MDFTKTTLGIEFGSTRVKAVLIDQSFRVIAEGVHDWENSFDGGYWTYAHDEILTALQQSVAALSKQVVEEVRAYFGDKVFESIIPRNVKLSEAPSHGLPINMYAPTSKGAVAYGTLADEVIAHG